VFLLLNLTREVSLYYYAAAAAAVTAATTVVLQPFFQHNLGKAAPER